MTDKVREIIMPKTVQPVMVIAKQQRCYYNGCLKHRLSHTEPSVKR